MSDQIYNCPIHGMIKAENCIQCVAARHKEMIAAGIISKKELKEGEGRKKNEPLPMSIKFRAFMERRKKIERQTGKSGPRHWETKRIVRVYKDPEETNGRFD